MEADTVDVVVTLSVETWDDVVRREFARPPDRMIRHLLSSPRVGRVLVVNPWRGVGSQARRRLGRDRDAYFPHTREHHLLRPVRVRTADRPAANSLERSYHAYSTLINLHAKAHGLRDPLLITFSPLVAAFTDHAGFRSVTYVGRDDWASYPPHRPMWPMYELAYKRMRDRSVRTSAVSQVLLDRLAPRGQSAVVPNGVDPMTWSSPAHIRPAPFEKVTGRIALYTGTIDDRLSLTALRSLADKLPDVTIALVGPQDPEVVRRIGREVPRILVLPPVGQRDLAALVFAADVCIVPHVRSDLTEAMSPLKIYEYLGAGRPVAAVDLLPIRGIDASVELCSEADFGSATRKALERGPMAETDRHAFLEANTWTVRCERVLDLACAR